jgi:hypothetical protein
MGKYGVILIAALIAEQRQCYVVTAEAPDEPYKPTGLSVNRVPIQDIGLPARHCANRLRESVPRDGTSVNLAALSRDEGLPDAKCAPSCRTHDESGRTRLA